MEPLVHITVHRLHLLDQNAQVPLQVRHNTYVFLQFSKAYTFPWEPLSFQGFRIPDAGALQHPPECRLPVSTVEAGKFPWHATRQDGMG